MNTDCSKLTERYLTVNQLSNYLNRSSGAVRNLVLRRAIPYRKAGGRLIFDKEEIDAWIKNSQGVSLEELIEKR
jgi:excisionase family DNA binding protein